jgi:glycosyltransferase involved in cell wall biosynthesis
MTIEICIPAFNEERVIAEAARSVVGVLQHTGDVFTVTVVDNASTDNTAQRAREIPHVTVLRIEEKGKGVAVIAAARQSRADVFGFIDADLSADPEEIPKLMAPIVAGECDIVIASRLIDTDIIHRGIVRTALSRLFNMARRRVVGIDIKDTQCGLKLMNMRGRDVLARCEERGWFFDMEFLARAERADLRIREMAVRWHEERFPGRMSKLSHVRDSFGAVAAMVRIRRKLRA